MKINTYIKIVSIHDENVMCEAIVSNDTLRRIAIPKEVLEALGVDDVKENMELMLTSTIPEYLQDNVMYEYLSKDRGEK